MLDNCPHWPHCTQCFGLNTEKDGDIQKLDPGQPAYLCTHTHIKIQIWIHAQTYAHTYSCMHTQAATKPEQLEQTFTKANSHFLLSESVSTSQLMGNRVPDGALRHEADKLGRSLGGRQWGRGALGGPRMQGLYKSILGPAFPEWGYLLVNP